MEDSATQILYVLKIQGQAPDQDRIQVRDDRFGLLAQGPLPITPKLVRQIGLPKGSARGWKTQIAMLPYGEIVAVETRNQESGSKNQEPGTRN